MPKSEAFLMDCMDYMRSLPDKAFDLCVCDPPYGIGQGGDKNKTRGKMAVSKDYHPFIDKKPPKEYFAELMRVSRNQIIWGGNTLPIVCTLLPAF